MYIAITNMFTWISERGVSTFQETAVTHKPDDCWVSEWVRERNLCLYITSCYMHLHTAEQSVGSRCVDACWADQWSCTPSTLRNRRHLDAYVCVCASKRVAVNTRKRQVEKRAGVQLLFSQSLIVYLEILWKQEIDNRGQGKRKDTRRQKNPYINS